MAKKQPRDPVTTAADLLAETPGHARLQRFCEAVRAGKSPSLHDMTALANAFEAILSQADGTMESKAERTYRALELTPPRGRPGPSMDELDRRTAAVVEVLELWSSGHTQQDAIRSVAEGWNQAPETIRSWFRAQRQQAERWLRFRDYVDTDSPAARFERIKRGEK